MEFILYSMICLITLAILKFYFNRRPITKLKKRMDGKTIIVTGSNSGLGKKTALQLLEDGADVIFASCDKRETIQIFKKIPKELKSHAHFLRLDLCSFKIIDKFINKFSKFFNKLDILIINSEKFPEDFKLTVDALERILQNNHLGPMYLTTQLLKYFDKNEGRIINVSNIFHDFSDLSEKNICDAYYDTYFENIKQLYYQGLKSRFVHYCNSKQANLFFTSYLAEQLELCGFKNIKICSVIPGIVCPKISKYYIDNHPLIAILIVILLPIVCVIVKNPEADAQTLLHLIYIDFVEFVNGGNYSYCNLINTTKTENNSELRNSYINYSLYLINVIARREINISIK